jgi:hypothetical protein
MYCPYLISPRPLFWNVMHQGEELGQSSCKMDSLWLSPINNFHSDIWANLSMKNKLWLFFMQWIYGTFIYWDNTSKLKWTIKASSTSWNNAFHPQRKKWVTKLFGYDYEIIYKKGK